MTLRGKSSAGEIEVGEGVPMKQTDLQGETERALRAITCEGCKAGETLIDGKFVESEWHYGTGKTIHKHSSFPCTSKHAELLPLFNAGMEQARKEVASAAWQVLGALFGINTPIPRIMNWFWAVAKPAAPDAPLFPLSQDERNALSAAIASAEARARLEEAKWWEHLAGEDHEDAKVHSEPCMYCDRMEALEAAARTPDSNERGKS